MPGFNILTYQGQVAACGSCHTPQRVTGPVCYHCQATWGVTTWPFVAPWTLYDHIEASLDGNHDIQTIYKTTVEEAAAIPPQEGVRNLWALAASD